MELSNRTLAILVVSSILLSVFINWYTINNIGLKVAETTGKATSTVGQVNLTIESTKSIALRGLTTIDFGSGYVNSSCSLATYANLTVDASGYSDLNDCWTSQNTAPNQPVQPFRIENDGNQNITLEVRCPDPSTFFGGYAGSNTYNLSWKGRANETSVSCPAGSLTSAWTSCSGGYQTVCNTNMNYAPDNTDEVAVDINILIPDGLTAAEYKNASITFRAQ